MHNLTRRSCAVAALAAGALVAAGPTAFAAGGGPARPNSAYSVTSEAAAWLVSQLTGPNKDHYVFPGTTYADDGNTADGVLALDAAGVAHHATERMVAWLQQDAGNYVGTAPNFYPGSLAKLLIVAEAEHVDVHDFDGNGLDLVTSLAGEENPDGLYQDPDTQYGYESTVSQALALIALSNTGDPTDAPDTAAIKWLTDQQCPDGGFRNNETPHTVTTCDSEVDTTSFAIQGLIEVGGDVTDAVTWLESQQNNDGGFGAPASDANSTAVAVQALYAAGHEPSLALAWLRKHQRHTCAPGKNNGAIRLNNEPFNVDTALRATTQAVQALALAPLAVIDGSDAAGKTPPTVICVPSEGPGVGTTGGSGGSGSGGGGKHHHHVKAIVDYKPVATLPKTGPPPLAPTAGIAVDLLFVGGLMAFFARRRSA
jgi:hypothetical protein